MKPKHYLLSLLVFSTLSMFSQTPASTFLLRGNIPESQRSFYLKSIEAANLETYRLRTQTVNLKFKNGFVVELLSAKELLVKGLVKELDLNNYPETYENPNYKLPLFEVLASGWLTAEVQTNTK